jgi:hypothetical protein
MVTIAARLAATVALCAVTTGAVLAQSSSLPGPTTPPKTLPVPNNPGADSVIAPDAAECQRGWLPGGLWTRSQFNRACAPRKVWQAIL